MIAKHPRRPAERICKRVVAVAGGRIVKARDAPRSPLVVETVPPGHVWLEGDNRAASRGDSNEVGAVPVGLVEGKVTARYRPQ